MRRIQPLCALAVSTVMAIHALPAAAVERSPLPPPSHADRTSVPARGWAALSGSTFKETLAGWAASVGWNVVWDLPVDYEIRASASFGGDFEQAVLSFSDAIYDHNPHFLVTIYRGNRVIHVREASPATAK